MSEAIDLAAKQTYQLVSFAHGGGTEYYTDWTSDVEVGGNVYLSTPDMEVKLPINNGLFDEQDCRVALPLATDPNDFTQRTSSGLKFPATTMTVSEVVKSIEGGPQTNVNEVFIGRVMVVRRNYRQNRQKVLFQALPIKSRMQTISLGLQCNHTCAHALGDTGCKVNMVLNRFTVTVSAIDGKEVTLTGVPTGKEDRYFHRGYLQFEGLDILIQEWRNAANGDESKFFMVRQPPNHWLGKAILAVAGCDKSVDTCRSRFNNEANFLGLGFAIPEYHPNFEDKSG